MLSHKRSTCVHNKVLVGSGIVPRNIFSTTTATKNDNQGFEDNDNNADTNNVTELHRKKNSSLLVLTTFPRMKHICFIHLRSFSKKNIPLAHD